MFNTKQFLSLNIPSIQSACYEMPVCDMVITVLYYNLNNMVLTTGKYCQGPVNNGQKYLAKDEHYTAIAEQMFIRNYSVYLLQTAQTQVSSLLLYVYLYDFFEIMQQCLSTADKYGEARRRWLQKHFVCTLGL